MSADCFRRGMVLQFEEIESGATFCIGNVHLPAKPSAIEGRLKTLSTAIKKTESCEPIRKVSPLDGLVLITGGTFVDCHNFKFLFEIIAHLSFYRIDHRF